MDTVKTVSKSDYKTNQKVIVEENHILKCNAISHFEKILHQEIGRDWNSYKIQKKTPNIAVKILENELENSQLGAK